MIFVKMPLGNGAACRAKVESVQVSLTAPDNGWMNRNAEAGDRVKVKMLPLPLPKPPPSTSVKVP